MKADRVTRRKKTGWAVLLLPVMLCVGLVPSVAFAHASDRGHVLLLPTGHYIVGGAATVALSFLVLVLVPQGRLDKLARWRLPLGALPDQLRLAGSALSFLFLLFLIAAGFSGSPDPLTNPLPLIFWGVFWVGLTLVQGLVGDVWRWIDPFYAPWRVLAGLTRGRITTRTLSARLGYSPAIIQFFAFVWFELVHSAPDNPTVLASAICVYFTVNLMAMLVFGHDEWARRGECLSAFLRMMARLGVIGGKAIESSTEQGRRQIDLCWPGARLVSALPLPPSGVLFLLLILSSVSFDGLMRTFFWLGHLGVNPLEFPGRSAVTTSSTFGLAGAFAVLGGAFYVAVALGERLVGKAGTTHAAAGVLVWSLVPITSAYHLAHYLPSLVIDVQYALAALADPFASRQGLFGAPHLQVHAGILMGADRVFLVWNLQAFAIVGGHLLAVLVAHVMAFRLHGSAKQAARSQLPLAVLMVFYTVFGLWLLSAPNAG